MRKKHFTLIEIMIVVAIIALLALIALPNFMKARDDARKSTCISNLKQIFSAKQQYALANSIPDTTVLTSTELNAYVTGNFSSIKCPAGGTYNIGNVPTNPTCNINGHALAQ